MILLLDSIPGSAIPRARYHTDKVAHFGMYAALGALTGRAVLAAGGGVPRLAAAWTGAAAFGAFDEWHQRFVPRRSPDVIDWMTDALGALFGVALAGWHRGRRQRPHSDDPRRS